ncbi:hypothetical protein [Bradyrhizobium sp. CCBAU 51745]|uniref:hypothetical protein n=1 Tax=Bradyrhizobium sp. CCBAU 51745 TaxID=1325099 RepID=UPI00230526B4|nr:hypothetical protein [Bradyrhizobium sp. CCBAU 51745]
MESLGRGNGRRLIAPASFRPDQALLQKYAEQANGQAGLIALRNAGVVGIRSELQRIRTTFGRATHELGQNLGRGVEKDWDQLDHVNFLTYQRIADLASIEIWRRARGGDQSEAGLQFVMTETYIRYVPELHLGALIENPDIPHCLGHQTISSSSSPRKRGRSRFYGRDAQPML